jgi:hypothetical protein
VRANRILPLAVAAAFALGVPAQALAASFSFDFGNLVNGSGPASGSFAHLTVNTTDFKSFTFDLKAGSNLDTVFGTTPGKTFLSTLYVNTLSNADPASVQILPGAWGVSKVTLNNGQGPSSSISTGTYSWDFSDGICSGSPCNNNGSNSLARLTAGEEVEWKTTFAQTQNPPFGTPAFAVKVQGFGSSGDYIVRSAIPEPETYMMLFAGLSLMGFVIRRRQKNFSV